MNLSPCPAPPGRLEPAPLTSLLDIRELGARTLEAYWGEDDGYFVKAAGTSTGTFDQPDNQPVNVSSAPAAPTVEWYRIAGGPADAVTEVECRAHAAAAATRWLDVTPIGAARIPFPVGSGGRTVYRVWRARKSVSGADGANGAATADMMASSGATGRTRILGVRAGRTLRRQA